MFVAGTAALASTVFFTTLTGVFEFFAFPGRGTRFLRFLHKGG